MPVSQIKLYRIQNMGIVAINSHKLSTGRYLDLCETYLPVVGDEHWRYSRQWHEGDPDQGWKLHVSATILTASEILEKIGPVLQKGKVLFKAPSSLLELGKLNAGVFYGYSQIGKFITIYPHEGEDPVALAEELHRLTLGIAAPAIPFDTQFRPGSNVYYRYGAFKSIEIEREDGRLAAVIRDADGNFVPDTRDSDGPPSWVTDPFPGSGEDQACDDGNPLVTTYQIFRALSQRGKGGVYNAVDLGADPPRLCIVKEGRKNGEVDWDGLDGTDYIRRESRNLKALQPAGPEIPAVYASFELEGNFYLVTEYIHGETLHKALMKRQRRLSLKKTLQLSLQVAIMMKQIHTAGWAWRDCKPLNLILTDTGVLRPIDFEGAQTFTEQRPIVWGTEEFLPPEWREKTSGESIVASDLYALGALIYVLVGGRYYDAGNPVPIEKLRRYIPRRTRQLVARLLSFDSKKRPETGSVITALNADLEDLQGRTKRAEKYVSELSLA